jgi:hypothetical protein
VAIAQGGSTAIHGGTWEMVGHGFAVVGAGTDVTHYFGEVLRSPQSDGHVAKSAVGVPGRDVQTSSLLTGRRRAMPRRFAMLRRAVFPGWRSGRFCVQFGVSGSPVPHHKGTKWVGRAQVMSQVPRV